MSNIEKGIYLEPVQSVITDINGNLDKNILLTGVQGGGKSVVLNELLKEQTQGVELIDGSVKNGEFIQLHGRLFNLYHICLLVKKMILHVQTTAPQEYDLFQSLDTQVSDILNRINLICTMGGIAKEEKYIDKYILENPECLIENFIRIATLILDYQQITLILDDFDKIGQSSLQYQKLMYTTLKKFEQLKFIATVSSDDVLNDYIRLEELRKKECLVNVGYSFDTQVVKTILGMKKEEQNLADILKDKTISSMSLLTNGNLIEIESAYIHLCEMLPKLNKEDYDREVLIYISSVINKSPMITGKNKFERKLYI